MNTRAAAPIGIFDSGVGGLSVLRHLRALLPAENFLYVADSGYAPYGERSPEFIRERSFYIANFLIEQGIKALVVACNTATAAAVQALREHLSIPVVAMEPGIKPAVEITKSKVVGVLATTGTLESARFFSLVNRYAGDVEIVTQPCAGLVERIEANDLNSADTLDLLRSYLDPLLARGADAIVLGCTHYPFLRMQIENVVREQIERKGGEATAGAEVAIIDTGPAVAKELKRRLESDALLCTEARVGREEFWSSGDLRESQPIFAQLWGASASVQALPENV
ncbi:MAG TPA: glutamate racemase [Spongiibacteraceae bacterium]|nr:glutamate racemase [Spongiibacteraceae bacterium]